MTVAFRPLRTRVLPDSLSGRLRPGDRDRPLQRLAGRGPTPRRATLPEQNYLHGLFDAGAGQRDAGVRALWDLVEQEDPRLDVTVRACRYPHRVRAWKSLPSGLFVPHQEPGPYVGAPPKEVRLAETVTVLKDEREDQAVRTVICREVVRGPKPDRWHPLFTTSLVGPDEVLGLFRARQRHEQAYRVGVYDEALDSVPCGYDKDSP